MFSTWIKPIITYGIIWPLTQLFTEKFAHNHFFTDIKLPDIGHELTKPLQPYISPLKPLKETMVYIPIIYSVYIFSGHLLDKFLSFICTIFIIRCLFYSVTLLPQPSHKSRIKSRWKRILYGGLHDIIFSGHVANYYGTLLFLQHHYIIPTTLFPFLSSLFIGLVAITYQDHYTIDILVSYPVIWSLELFILKH